MEFFIKRTATLPTISIDIIRNGKNDYERDIIESGSTVYFSMKNADTNEYKIINEDTVVTENSIHFQFKNKHTKKNGRFIGEFILKTDNGVANLDLKEDLFINIVDSLAPATIPSMDPNAVTSDNQCCGNAAVLQLMRCVFYQDFGFHVNNFSSGSSITSFIVDGIELLSSPFYFEPQNNYIIVDGMEWYTNMVDALNSINVPNFTFTPNDFILFMGNSNVDTLKGGFFNVVFPTNVSWNFTVELS